MNPFHAIADPNRRQMLDLLRTRGPLRAGEIVAHFPHISQPAVSKHLRVLRSARLVRTVKHGREQWYHLDVHPLEPVAQWLGEYEMLWAQRLERLKQVAEAGAEDAGHDQPDHTHNQLLDRPTSQFIPQSKDKSE
jgi:DNA-binding transcriptional ArsR family regulator